MASVHRIDKTDEARRQAAIKWLAIVRQATLDKETVLAYEVGLRDMPIAAVEQAIKDIGMAPRGEYEHSWPELGVIRARAGLIVRIERERAESRRLLSPPPQEPVSPEKVEEFLAKLRAVIQKKAMR